MNPILLYDIRSIIPLERRNAKLSSKIHDKFEGLWSSQGVRNYQRLSRRLALYIGISLPCLQMHDTAHPKIAKWSFFLGDILLVGAAGLIYLRSNLPFGLWEAALIVLSIGAGAVLAILPFVLEYRVVARACEAQGLTDAVEQIRNLETLAQQITGATARWQSVQEVADRVAGTSKAIAERMSAETKAFTDFIQRANDSEKSTLRLEVEKMRRAEGEWIQVVVRMLDHVYALHTAAVRSAQPKLIAQLDQFQHACRDATRRMGLTPFTANLAEPFDPEKHQVVESNEKPKEGAVVSETVATGYTFQGRLLRPALVRVQLHEEAPESTDQAQLPLTASKGA
jgi:molecular chaperone GrpE (heat shock protein)